jgi:Carboxypeptidase regulatory-like domain/TonB-dependent Receptor Plug Domain
MRQKITPMYKIFLFVLSLLAAFEVTAQSAVVRGIVLDKQSETPLIGAAVEIIGSNPRVGSVTDEDGRFVINGVPVGRISLGISYIGYDNAMLPNVLVTAGKDVQLVLTLTESFGVLSEVVVTAEVEKDRAVNEMATISARQFNVEEVQRFSGGRNDVAKLVANFAGVVSNNDARNDIIIRGNSPTGVLWRMEGVPIPNPNHFSTLGTTGGPVSALNPNMIGNSDFLTGAFPSEYGNALAGVFDINLRTGNPDKFEFTTQLAAFSGLEAMIEGPLGKKGNGGSFVVAYRHSFVELAAAAGLNVGTTATPAYRDLTFNLNFGNGKYGKWSLFGIGGLSNIDFLGAETDTTDLFARQDQDAYVRAQFGVTGLKHSLIFNDHSYLRSVLSVTYSANNYTQDNLDFLPESPFRDFENINEQTGYKIQSTYNNKVNKKMTLRAGILGQIFHQEANMRSRNRTPDIDGDGLPDWWQQTDFNGELGLFETYVQSLYRLTEKLTLNTGLHAQYFDKTEDIAVEPRLGLGYQISAKSTINAGYGMHNQTQPFPVFFFRTLQPDGTSVDANTNLGFSRSQHFVIGYDYKPAPNWRIKAETYFQYIDKVPVDAFSSSFSMLNTGADFVFPERGNLVNNGTGTNLGLELTAEKFFSKGFYGLVTVSLFDAKYKGSDGIERSTAFNGQYVANMLGGREFAIGSTGRRFLTFDTKLTAAGGRPYTPVDLAASQAAGREILKADLAFSQNLDDYFRWDVKFGFRLNNPKRKLSQTFFLDLQNVTNNENIFAQRYNEVTGTVGKTYQIGFFPDILYRVEF